jgi:nucleoside-diphosphate-sugar epimerase
MKHVLVTGATGFIGAHLIRALKEKSVRINALVRDPDKGHRLWGDGVRFFTGDIFDTDRLAEAVRDVDTVFHLVSKTHDFSTRAGIEDDYYRINVVGTQNLLEACCAEKIKHFVYVSSVKAMTEKTPQTIDEQFVPQPTTAYGKTKLEAERMVRSFSSRYRFAASILRLPLVYGPGNKGNMLAMIKAIDGGRFFLIGNGSNRRSMAYVGNVVHAALAAASVNRGSSSVYIVTDGADYTLKEIYESIARELGRKTKSICIPLGLAKIVAKAGDMGHKLSGRSFPFNTDMLEKLTGSLTFSSDLISRDIGFRPAFSWNQALAETIQWYRHEMMNPGD